MSGNPTYQELAT